MHFFNAWQIASPCDFEEELPPWEKWKLRAQADARTDAPQLVWEQTLQAQAQNVPHSIYDELRGLVEALPNEEQPAAEPTPSTEWVERTPLPRKRQPEKSWTPHPPEPQRAKPADTKPVPQAGPWTPHPPAPKQGSSAAAKSVPQAVSGPAVPVQQAMPHSVTPQAAVRTQHDDIRQRLFSDSVQRQLFARHVLQRPQRATLQGFFCSQANWFM